MTWSSGNIITWHCTCMAGQGSVCSHVASILFKIEACGRVEMNKEPACTSLPCLWNQTFTKKVQGEKAAIIDFRKPKRGQDHKDSLHLKRNYIFKDTTNFLKRLKVSQPNTVIFSVTTPNVQKLQQPTFPPLMDTFFDEKNSTLSSEELKVLCNKTLMSIENDIYADQIEKLSDATRDQRQNSAWFAYRKGRLTASNFYEISHTDLISMKSVSLLKKIMQYGKDNNCIKSEAIA
ncbi:hypothetical protein LOTGIDRAFT_163776 [Lottia gigantea]|uniref:SWIM-type domain-containing protein n=1 Tax=Lottia gigantea TaxID=225164 RepID=V3ZI07_LOTGI|nr:hypothetical protein LOTGIDRAFT_163776 [Lottia gigantea]ESO90888.1 hypothetical protein LOTGIDRAFT_163776 [Lottia gigantea]